MYATPTTAAITVTVMPDYGNGPYAWAKPSTDISEYVGQCIATARHPFELEDGTGISARLQAQFSEWTVEFEVRAHRSDFRWKEFHHEGLELSCRLKRELGSNYRVIYLKPCEDPNAGVNEYTIVEGDA